MKASVHHARLLRLFALGVFGISFFLLPAPSARANPAPPPVDPAMDLAGASGLLQFTSQGHVLGFQAGGFYVSNATYALRVEFVGANAVVPASDTAADSGLSQQGAPPLNRVTYANLWEGITLAYDGARGGVVSSSYRVEAGADPRAIRLRYNAPVTVNSGGTLRIAYATGELIESAPLAWQEIEGERVAVIAEFALLGEREIGFELGEYDAERPLFIDPTLTWNTFLGGGGIDRGNAMAVDGNGNVYIAGTAQVSWGLPVRSFSGGWDAYAAKLNASGAVIWNTFLGGSGSDSGAGIAVDGSGNVYVAGYSGGTWQGANPPVRAFAGFNDGFVAKLDSTGAVTWNTFLGGSGHDYPWGVAVDGIGNVYIAGSSTATWGSPLRVFSGDWDGYAAKLDESGALTWNTFLGGSGSDVGAGIAVDGGGNVYVAGYSNATWGGPIRSYTSDYDAFAAKLNASGGLGWNTFLGGNGTDYGNGIAVNGSGNVYVAGSSATTWQGTAPPVRGFTGPDDTFAAKLNAGGALTWNTFLGGSGSDSGAGIAVDGSGNVYVAGYGGPWQGANPPVRAYTDGYDTFAAKLNASGAVTWNTFLGGTRNDEGYAIAVDGSGNVYVAGTSPATWQGTSAPVRAYTGGEDTFVAKLGSSGSVTWNTFLGGAAQDHGTAVAVDGSGNVYVVGYSDAKWGSPKRDHASGYDAYAAKLDSTGRLVWNTFLGGDAADYGNAIAVDEGGNVYVAGRSLATWQGTSPPVRPHTALYDGFVAKLDASGALAWNTFVGGNGTDYGTGIAVDGSGNVYVGGYSNLSWQGTSPPVQGFAGSNDAFVAKLNPNGVLAWNTFLGGGMSDYGNAIAIDGGGNVYVAGYSNATWGGPVRAFNVSPDAFAAKMNPSGELIWNTFLGGNGSDWGTAIAVDGSGNVYVAGRSGATWQGTSAPVRAYTSGDDAFAAKLNSGGALTWNTFLGGSGEDYGYATGVDGSGNVYVAGYSTAAWGSPVRAYSLGIDGFAVKLDSSGALKWNSFLGGSGSDWGMAIAVDGRGNAYVVGESDATWQGASAPRNAYTSGRDAFVATIFAFDGYLPLIGK